MTYIDGEYIPSELSQEAMGSAKTGQQLVARLHAENERLKAALREAGADLVGCCRDPDDPFVGEALRRMSDALCSVTEQVVAPSLPSERCDQCDNGLEPSWEYCAYCAHPIIKNRR
ncbi:MAG: hypothetical protein IT537_03095 [Hyphomicrobiales bacterium]|nr:hypothetical protein [Hyphomicrobiales bacterium]